LFYSLVKVQCDVCAIGSSSSLSGQLGECRIGDHHQHGLIMYAHTGCTATICFAKDQCLWFFFRSICWCSKISL